MNWKRNFHESYLKDLVSRDRARIVQELNTPPIIKLQILPQIWLDGSKMTRTTKNVLARRSEAEQDVEPLVMVLSGSRIVDMLKCKRQPTLCLLGDRQAWAHRCLETLPLLSQVNVTPPPKWFGLGSQAQNSISFDLMMIYPQLNCCIFGCGRSTHQGMDKVWNAHAHTFDCSSLAEQSSAVMMCLQTSWSPISWRKWFVTSSPGFKISQLAPILTNVYTGNKT